MEKVSIVVPVYNAGKYLEKTIRSLFQQTYKNCEIILIDDGSEDNSADIICQFVEEYADVKCVFQENQGVGVARNRGIARATGKYVTFVDSDDYVAPNFIESYMKVIGENPYAVAGGYYIQIHDGPVKEKAITRERLKIMKAPSACFRLFDADWLKQNNLSFGTWRIGEDLNFTGKAQLLYPEYPLTEKAAYHYFIRSGSVVGTADESQFELLDAVTDLENFAKQRDLFQQNEAELEYMVISHILMAGMKRAAEGDVIEKALKIIPEFVYRAHPNWYNNPYIEKYADEKEKQYLKAVYEGNESGMREYAEQHW